LKSAAVPLMPIVSRGVPVGLATSSDRANYYAKTTHHGPFYARFQRIMCGDKVVCGKPNPEIYLMSMQRLGLPIQSLCSGPRTQRRA